MNIHYHKSILKYLPYTANVYKQTTLYIQPSALHYKDREKYALQGITV